MAVAVTTIEAMLGAACPRLARWDSSSCRRAAVWAIGNLQILEQPLLGFFCSTKYSNHDLAITLRNCGAYPMIGGFHTPMEKECLALLLRRTPPMVMCPARSIAQLRLYRLTGSKPWRRANRLLLLSFEAEHHHPTIELTEPRNRFSRAVSAHLDRPRCSRAKRRALSCRLLHGQAGLCSAAPGERPPPRGRCSCSHDHGTTCGRDQEVNPRPTEIHCKWAAWRDLLVREPSFVMEGGSVWTGCTILTCVA